LGPTVAADQRQGGAGKKEEGENGRKRA